MTDRIEQKGGVSVLLETANTELNKRTETRRRRRRQSLPDDCTASIDFWSTRVSLGCRKSKLSGRYMNENEWSTNEDPEESMSMFTVSAQCTVQILPESPP
jgi:hypothetical protein